MIMANICQANILQELVLVIRMPLYSDPIWEIAFNVRTTQQRKCRDCYRKRDFFLLLWQTVLRGEGQGYVCRMRKDFISFLLWRMQTFLPGSSGCHILQRKIIDFKTCCTGVRTLLASWLAHTIVLNCGPKETSTDYSNDHEGNKTDSCDRRVRHLNTF